MSTSPVLIMTHLVQTLETQLKLISFFLILAAQRSLRDLSCQDRE